MANVQLKCRCTICDYQYPVESKQFTTGETKFYLPIIHSLEDENTGDVLLETQDYPLPARWQELVEAQTTKTYIPIPHLEKFYKG